MADPTTLLDLRVAQRDAAALALTEAETAQSIAQAATIAARTLHGDRLAARADREAELASIRSQLAQPGLQPADAAALADDLRDGIIALRRATAEMLDAARALATAEATLASAAQHAASTRSRHQGAVRDQAAAADRAARLQGWRDALAAPPLDTLTADAATAIAPGAEPLTAARTRIEADVPEPLRLRAAARHARSRTRAAAELASVVAAVDQKEAAAAADGGTLGAVVPLDTAVTRTEAALGGYARYAGARHEQALAALQSTLDAGPLSDDQRARLFDPGALADRTEAADRAGDLATAQAALEDAQLAIDDQRRMLVGEDIDVEIENTHPALAPLIAAVPPLQQAVTDAETAFTPAMAERLDRWEAALPDDLWRQHVAYEDALARLQATAVPDPDPAALDADLVAAEATWVAALLTHDGRRRTHEHLARTATRLHTQRESHQRLARADLLSAVRGDR